MKKYLLLLLLFFTKIIPIPFAAQLFQDETCAQFACEHSCDCKAVSHSFFSIRPVYTINSPEYLSHNRDFYKRSESFWSGTLQVTPLGGSSNHNESIARFFLPFCNTTLNVSEQPVTTNSSTILARNFNIYTQNGTFASTVEFKPRQTYAGVGFNWQQKIYERSNGKSIWISFSGPLLHVRNRVELVETILDNGGGPIAVNSPSTGSAEPVIECNADCSLNPLSALQPVGSVEQAFAQPGWCFGRVDPNQHQSKTGFGDLTFRIGYETVNKDDCHLDSFFGVVFPTGNKPDGVILFEPIVGHNHHWGIVLGTVFGIEVLQAFDGDLTISNELDFSVTELFEHTERRSFDLHNKPWSRYMQFYKNREQAQAAAAAALTNPNYALALHTPGIDILTQDVKIKPGFYRMFNGAFIINYCDSFTLEAGYNFYARQSECIHLACPLPTTIAPKAIGVGSGSTSSFQSISIQPPDGCISSLADYDSNILTEADLNLESAAHPATITHTVYGSFAYEWKECGYPMFVSVAASYEFPPDNVGLNRWMVWGKYGVAF